MAGYSPSDIYQALLNVGIPSLDAATLTQISGAESRYGASPIGALNRNGTTDYGVFQINSGAWPQLSPSSLVDAPLATQAQAAATVYKQQGLTAWSTYNSGAYQNYPSGVTPSDTSPATDASNQSWWNILGQSAGNALGTVANPLGSAISGIGQAGSGAMGSAAQSVTNSVTGAVSSAVGSAASGAIDKLTGWLGSISTRFGLFVLAIVFIIGALVLFGIKSGVEIQQGGAS